MNIIIVGAGTIGQSIAEVLLTLGEDVVVIDLQKEALERLEERLDVQTIRGDGCDPAVLKAARVEGSHVVMALTRDERSNLLAATVAKRLGAAKSIARVRSPHFLRPEGFDYREALGIDLVICPEVLTAAQIVKYLDNPDALALEFYAQGKVQLVKIELEADHPYCNKTPRELNLPGGVLVVLVTRGSGVLIPKGQTTFLAGDKITLLGKSGALNTMKPGRGRSPQGRFKNVTIAGGGRTGALLAAALEGKIPNVKLLEWNLDRCRELAAQLDKTTVLHGDATTRSFLTEERVGQADVFVAAMQTDEDNIMASLLARNLGAGKCVAIVKRPDYTPLLVENTKIDLALSPREVTAGRVLALMKRGLIQNISLLEDGRAEVIEFRAGPRSPLIGKPLKEIVFPDGCLVGMIGRGNTVRIGRGDDKILAGDTVIMLTLAEVSKEVEALF
jgi:trk system potassium uptake protein TrkA